LSLQALFWTQPELIEHNLGIGGKSQLKPEKEEGVKGLTKTVLSYFTMMKTI